MEIKERKSETHLEIFRVCQVSQIQSVRKFHIWYNVPQKGSDGKEEIIPTGNGNLV